MLVAVDADGMTPNRASIDEIVRQGVAPARAGACFERGVPREREAAAA
jgi:hypothetical protein